MPHHFKFLLITSVLRFFYSGLARRKSALSLIWLSIMSVGVVSFQWFFWYVKAYTDAKASDADYTYQQGI
jgi:ammonia channel protein AmtB